MQTIHGKHHLSIGQINLEILIDRIFFSGGRWWNAAQIAIGHQVFQILWSAPLLYGAFPDRLGQLIEHRGDLSFVYRCCRRIHFGFTN